MHKTLDLVKSLESAEYSEKRENLATYMERYSWELVINDYDKELEELGQKN